MSSESEFDTWSAGQSYEHYMGRWSRKIATKFVEWLAPAHDADWLEVGCGTGALTKTVLSSCSPRSILATDQSADFVAHAHDDIDDSRAHFEVADALHLPSDDASVDIVVSALVMNFIPHTQNAFAEMHRVLRPGGLFAFYVWDYPGGGMGFIDAFWKSAAEIDSDAIALDESARFPFCTKAGLAKLCEEAGIPDATIVAIEAETSVADFEAFWHPFTLGAGPAPGYCMNLDEDKRKALKDRLAAKLGTVGTVTLPARAWAVKARWPSQVE